MSKLYDAAEQICYFTNRLPGGGVKKRMTKMLTTSTGDEHAPAWLLRYCHVKRHSFRGYPFYVIKSREKERQSEKFILFLHGGGGMSRPTPMHYDTISRISKMTGMTVILPFYPLAPVHNVRDALIWLEGFAGKLFQKYGEENIIFMGDSAGANLCLSLAGRMGEKPSGLIAISPALGLQNGEPREIRKEMEPKDPILSVEMNDIICANWSRGVPLDSADISPEFVDYTEFPKMLIVYGTHELFYPHVKNFRRTLFENDIPVEIIEKQACHDFALCSFLPEGREAMRGMAEWCNER